MEQVMTFYEAFSNLHVSVICPLSGGLQCSSCNLSNIFWFILFAIMLIFFARRVFEQRYVPLPQPRPEPASPRRRRAPTPATTIEAPNQARASKIIFPQYIVTDNVPYFLHEEETLDYDWSNSMERTAEWVDKTNFIRAWREYRGSSVDVHENYLCESCIYCKSERDGYIC